MKIDGLFLPLPNDLLGSAAFIVAPPAAMKILLAIGSEWLQRGCRDNGELVVTYKTLRIATGINDKHALSLGLKQLEALGLLRNKHGKSMAGSQKNPNKYGLPWLPGHNGGPPTKEYLEVESEEHGKRLLEGMKRKRSQSEWFKTGEVVGFPRKKRASGNRQGQ
jgi:hypothetical protein